MKTANEIATEAARLVGGDRAQQHGDKGANFNATALLWNAYLSIRKGGAAAPITGSDFANMMVLAKMSRVHTGSVFNMDNFVDMAGYAACAGEVALQESEAPLTEYEKKWKTMSLPMPSQTLVSIEYVDGKGNTFETAGQSDSLTRHNALRWRYA